MHLLLLHQAYTRCQYIHYKCQQTWLHGYTRCWHWFAFMTKTYTGFNVNANFYDNDSAPGVNTYIQDSKHTLGISTFIANTNIHSIKYILVVNTYIYSIKYTLNIKAFVANTTEIIIYSLRTHWVWIPTFTAKHTLDIDASIVNTNIYITKIHLA